MMILLTAAVLFFIGAFPSLAATGEDVIDTAEKYLGYPYSYHSAGPNAFDCGGFVWYVYDQAGIDFGLRINSADLAAENTAIYDADQLEIGDIIFFGSSPESIYHWGIYAGNNQVIHSYNYGTGVTYTPLDQVVPGFCYAARLDSLLGCNFDYSADFLEAIPLELEQAVADQVIPLGMRHSYEDNITIEEMTALLTNLYEIISGNDSDNLLAEYGLTVSDFRVLWQDPLALASRALAVAEELSSDISQEEAVEILLLELFRPADITTVVPEVRPEPSATVTVSVPDTSTEEANTGAFAIAKGKSNSCVEISNNALLAESEQLSEDSKLISANSESLLIFSISTEASYSKMQAFLTTLRIYEIFMALE